MKPLIFILSITLFGQLFLLTEKAYNTNIATTCIGESVKKSHDNELGINETGLANRQLQNSKNYLNGDREYNFNFNLFRVAVIFICIGSVMGLVGFILLIAASARRKKMPKKVRELRAEVANLPRTQIDRYVNLNEILAGLEFKEKKLKDKVAKNGTANSRETEKLDGLREEIEALKKEIGELKDGGK